MPRRYVCDDEDNDRWHRFAFREGDVVVSTRSKSGTTWMQQIVVTLLHGGPDLPAPLREISPWLDWLTEPEADLFSRLEAQPGRRVIKTHTPLDGVVIDPRAQYVVVVRDPLDVAVSLYWHRQNLDRRRMAQLIGHPYVASSAPAPLARWLRDWTLSETDPMTSLDSLQGAVHHAVDAQARRDDDRVLVLRYEDLVADLEAQMRRLADRLGATVEPDAWPGLVEAAGFESMRAADSAPDRRVFKDPGAFFRRGRPGAGREVLAPADVAAYESRVRSLVATASPDAPDSVLTLLGLRTQGSGVNR